MFDEELEKRIGMDLSLAVRICMIFCMRFSAAIVRVILLRGILGSKRVK